MYKCTLNILDKVIGKILGFCFDFLSFHLLKGKKYWKILDETRKFFELYKCTMKKTDAVAVSFFFFRFFLKRFGKLEKFLKKRVKNMRCTSVLWTIFNEVFLKIFRFYYLFTQVGAFRAFLSPGFFLSTDLGSLFKNPFSFKTPLASASIFTRALAIPSLIASACALIPEPFT